MHTQQGRLYGQYALRSYEGFLEISRLKFRYQHIEISDLRTLSVVNNVCTMTDEAYVLLW